MYYLIPADDAERVMAGLNAAEGLTIERSGA
jgi:hypothetical protein